MLDLRFRNLSLVSFVIGQEYVVPIVEEYDKQSIFPMLLICYHIFHIMAKFGLMANMQIDEENSFNIFEMYARTSEPTKQLVKKEVQMFRTFQVDVKDIKCPLE
jgi:hypothetical protein